MTSALQRFGHFALALVAAGLLAPASGLAQIASPGSAGANSGNGSSGSSNTTISNPTFTQVESVSTVTGVTVSNPSTITVSPTVATAIQTTLTSVVQNTPLPISTETAQAIVGTSGAPTAAASVLVGPAAEATTISIGSQSTSLAALPDILPTAVSSGSVTVTNASGVATSISVPAGGDSVSVVVGSGDGASTIQITTTPETQAAVSQFAAYAAAAGLSPASIATGAQLAGLLTQLPASTSIQAAVQVVQLMAAIQGLSSQTNLANMEQGISTFNQILSSLDSPSVPDSVVVALTSNPTFTTISTILASARAAMN